jgi:PAS domain S-box-containing protein
MRLARPRWLSPWLLGAGGFGLAAVIALNAFTFLAAAGNPTLLAAVLVADALLLVASIAAALWYAQRYEEQRRHARAALDASHARISAIIDSAMDAIITVDEAQRIVLFNRAAEIVFRCGRGDALGTPLERFIAQRFRAAHRGHIERFGRTGTTSRRMGDVTTLWGLRADGEEFPLEASISQTQEAGGRFYTVILRDIALRKQAEDTLLRQQAELRELSARVLEAREEEKTLLARELHDELGQLLTALKMDLAWLRERLPPPGSEMGGKAAQMEALLDRTVTSVRRISADLRPLMLDDLGLPDAVAWLVEDFAAHSGIECRLTLPEEPALEDLERSVANTVYRVLQESLTNIGRHAGARHAWVVLGAARDALQIEVEDDGRGIGADDLAHSRSLGLKGMRERVLYHGGTLEIGRAPRGGTRVLVRVPRPRTASGA